MIAKLICKMFGHKRTYKIRSGYMGNFTEYWYKRCPRCGAKLIGGDK
jgi:hypothetical protein